MDKVMVYFTNGCKAQFDMDKVSFSTRDGMHFGLVGTEEKVQTYAGLMANGTALINWENVSFIQKVHEKTEDDG